MLFADAPTITISLEAAGTLGATLAAGLAGAMKLFTGYLKARDKTLTDEVRANRVERTSFAQTVMTIHKEAMSAVHGVEIALTKLTDRFDKTGEHVPLDPDRG